VLHLGASVTPDALARLAERSSTARRSLFLWTEALADRGLVDGTRLPEIRAGKGYRDDAEDILRLVAILRASWAQIHAKLPLDAAELDAAEETAQKLLAAVHARELTKLDASETVQLRGAAFTLFYTAWDQIRRVVQYVRWNEDDADGFAPSLFLRTPRRSGRDGPDAVTKSPTDGAAAPASVVGGGAVDPKASATETPKVIAAPGSNGATPSGPGARPFVT
jgi:hypothetical protein